MLTAVLALSIAAAPAADDPAWHRLVGLIQYLAGDYEMAVKEQNADELAEQRGLIAEALQAVDAIGPGAEPYRAELQSLRARIDQAQDAEGVAKGCGALAQKILAEQKLQRAPRATPDLGGAKTTWGANCALCHGPNGDAKMPVAETLNPKPVSFHDAERMASLTPYRAFNTATFGVQGTAMAAFAHLPEADRWALAFYAFTFRQPPCDHVPPAATLQELAQSTDAQLAAKFGEKEVACLRRKLPEEKVAGGLFGPARGLIAQAQQLSTEGKHDAARAAVVDAYLNGVEPVEPTLRARNPAGVQKLENAFTRARIAADQNEDFPKEAAALLLVMDELERGQTRGDFWSVFFAALLILLREGFEALVVVGALLAVLKKLNAQAQARVVYAAIAAAVALGLLALLFAQKLLGGANREWMETIVAFFAVGMLLYAALWLNARSNMSAFMTELRGQMQTAIGAGSSLGLFTVAFTAVARESFETALFIQGLAGDSATGALWGAAAGLGALAVLVIIIRRVGFVLPMKTLFSASTALLLATAVMVLGKGLHGLQEVGVLGLKPVPFFQLDALGIFPDAVTLVPQAVLAGLALWWWKRSTAAPPRTTPLAT